MENLLYRSHKLITHLYYKDIFLMVWKKSYVISSPKSKHNIMPFCSTGYQTMLWAGTSRVLTTLTTPIMSHCPTKKRIFKPQKNENTGGGRFAKNDRACILYLKGVTIFNYVKIAPIFSSIEKKFVFSQNYNIISFRVLRYVRLKVTKIGFLQISRLLWFQCHLYQL